MVYSIQGVVTRSLQVIPLYKVGSEMHAVGWA